MSRPIATAEKLLAALDRIAALDVEAIVPGHGEPRGNDPLREQAQIVENWVGFVETHVDRGAQPGEILKEPIPVTRQDPYRSDSFCSCMTSG